MPNHVIRDRIWVSKKLAQCSLKAALAYPWIYLVCDDWGRFEYEPAVIWRQVFARRDDVSLADVDGWLEEYQKVGLLQRYHIAGELAFWTGFYRGGRLRPSAYPDPAQFVGGVVVDCEQSPTEKVVVPTERNETQRNETEGAPAPKFAVRKKAKDTSLEQAVIDAYNRVLDCRIGYTPGNIESAARATNRGYTLEQITDVFQSVKDRRTETAKWCAANNHSFEYLTRPPYRGKQGVVVQGPLDKIPNELTSSKVQPTTGTGEAARMTQLLAEKAARKALNG